MLPTITHIHASVLPVLAAGGTLLLEAQAHRTLYDGARIAAGAGATVHRFRLDDPDRLADLLRNAPVHAPRVVVADGVNSMTGNPPDLPPARPDLSGARRLALHRRRARLRRAR